MKSHKLVPVINVILSFFSKAISLLLKKPFDVALLSHNGIHITTYPETKWLLAPFPAQKLPIYNADNLATVNRAYFLETELFQSSKNAAESRWRGPSLENKVRDISWRLHVFLWAINYAIIQKSYCSNGIFVECGTGKGYMAAGALNQFGCELSPFFLVDNFESDLVTKDSRMESPASFAYADDFQEVEKYFSPYTNVHLIRGMIPDALVLLPKEPIIFLHIDLNDAFAEAVALKVLKSRLVKGSIILFDDYGGPGGEKQAREHQTFANSLKLPLLELPTGQAILLI